MPTNLILLMGLPGTNKAAYNNRLPQDAFIFSNEAIQKAVFGEGKIYHYLLEQYDGSYEKTARAYPNLINREYENFVKRVQHINRDVVVDMTLLTPKKRKHILSLFGDMFDVKKCVYIVSSDESCMKNNRKNNNISPEVFNKMKGMLVPPSISEGFDEVIEYNLDKKTIKTVKRAKKTVEPLNEKLIYDGVFFEVDTIEAIRKQLGITSHGLEVRPAVYHMTINFYGNNGPLLEQKKIIDASVGMELKVKIIGYGNDKKTEALLCEGQQNNGTPYHITLSTDANKRAKDSSKLTFGMLVEPITITGKFYPNNHKDLFAENYKVKV